MKPIVSMRHALTDPDLFGSILIGPSWDAWRVLLIALMGEELSESERAVYKELTGRAQEPDQAVKEAWLAPLIRDGAIFCVDAPFRWRGARGRSAFLAA